MDYNWHRFYDPSTGRYISADPIGLDGGMNFYAYVQNDPINKIDPWGLFDFHGEWCGPDHTGGYPKSWGELSEGEKRNAIPPRDGMDSCCQDHDRCYARCREQYPCDEAARQDCQRLCDIELYNCVQANPTPYPSRNALIKRTF
ncbi:MAG: hypothetical protein GY702_05660 [Desulfobulbaceae bacterium]|nr:hypothetical protein [Desulfobulbaceae bacterium]